jgi:hypothetical protein
METPDRRYREPPSYSGSWPECTLFFLAVDGVPPEALAVGDPDDFLWHGSHHYSGRDCDGPAPGGRPPGPHRLPESNVPVPSRVEWVPRSPL